jgi:transposase
VQAVCGLLAGAYRVGTRGVARLMGDLFGLPIGPAAVCDLQHKTAGALEPVAAAQAHVAGKPANVDETGWREGRARGWLGVAVTAAVTVLLVRLSRGRKVPAELIPGTAGVLTTDRYPAYDHLPPGERQVCWAHLRRDFQAMIDRGNPGSGVGEDLLMHADILLMHWTRVRDGRSPGRASGGATSGGFGPRCIPCSRAWPGAGARRRPGCAGNCWRSSRRCTRLRRSRGVEPTNNAAERALRHAVCWRKTSYGTDSAGGSRFVERVLTVVASCRQQGRDVLAFLTDAIQAARAGTKPPSLIPVHASTP